MDLSSHTDFVVGTPPLHVFVVDDVPSARAGLCAVLMLTPDIEVTGEAADGVEALERLAATPPDVVILDIEMPRMDGLEVTRQLRAQGSTVHVVVLSVAFDRRQDALDAGADAFIHKGEPMANLIQVLESFRLPPPKPPPAETHSP